MGLQTETLKEDLKSLYKETASNSEQDEAAALEQFCDRMASLIEKYIKTASVVYTNGLTAPNGPVAGTFNHTIE